MNFVGSRHCKILRSIGVPLGLWPYRRTILCKVNGAIALTIIILYIVAQLTVFITHEVSVDLFLKCVLSIEPPIAFIVKYLFFMWNIDQVKYVFEWIQSDYDSLTEERELRLIEKSADKATIISKIILYFLPLLLITLGFPVLSRPFSTEARVNQSFSGVIPFNVEYFVDQDRYFYWIMFHIVAATLLGACIIIFTELTIVCFITHVCGLLEIIGDRVERILESSVQTALYDKTDLLMNDQLVAAITLHQRTLKFIEKMNTSFLPHYCILVAISVLSLSICLCIMAREILQRKITNELLIAFTMVIGNFLYMGCGNYVSQYLLDSGDELFTKTYYARWHEAPLPVQKMLLYMRQRSILPTGIVVGGLYTGSFEFFFKLVNTSMSYFTVLYSTA